jgi:putative transposase
MAQKNLGGCDAHDLRKLVDHEDCQLPLSREFWLLWLPWPNLNYKPIPVPEFTLRIMARIDALYLDDPAFGGRRMVDDLANESIPISRDRVRNLMRCMGLGAIDQKPRTTVPGDPATRFPCLVELNQITAVHQVWATNIFTTLRKGLFYLFAANDLFLRHILVWKLSNSLDTEFCLEAMEMAFVGGSQSEIFYSDQGTQFSSSSLLSVCRRRKSRSAGLAGEGVLTTFLSSDCGGPSSIRSCICGLTAMVWWLSLAWPDFSGAIVM